MELFKLFGTIAVNNSDANKALDETTDNAEKTHSKMSSVFGKIGNAALEMGKVVAKAAAATTAAATAGFAALTKASVESYAEYEQLVGGVETLFGAGGASLRQYAAEQGTTVKEVAKEYENLMNAQNTVFDNAANAYKTAGLSANEYMETVTSFSASLLQSLGGDTQQAAEMADMAITDMADNANKMGTSMESIQNAYQGFAKQNYTMLDNLKLGYGGTKEEMQRLLEDATAISGVEYDISSYADIVDAIHVVQTEMGITGTTAKEASTTIQGSVSSMKAAWTNFLTGMADEDQDFGALTDNLVNSVVTVAENLAPRLVETVPRLLEGLKQVAISLASHLPELIGEMFPGAEEGVASLMEAIQGTISTLVDDVLPVVFQTITQLLPPLLQIASEVLPMIAGIIKEILPAISAILPSLMTLIQSVLPIITDLIQQLLPPIIQIVEALMPIFVELIQQLLPPILQIVEMVLPLLMQLLDPLLTLLTPLMDILQPILDLIMAIIEPLVSILNVILPPLIVIIESIISIFTGQLSGAIKIVSGLLEARLGTAFKNMQVVVETMKTVFTNFIEFFKNVFTGNWSAAWENIKNIFTAVWEGIKSIFKNVVNGILGGVESLINGVIRAINGLLSGIDKVVGAVGDVLGLDWNLPTLSEIALPRLAKGGILEQGQVGLLEGDGTEAVVPLEKNREWIARVSEEMQVQGLGGDKETLNVLQEILAVMTDLKESNADLPDILTDAIANLKFSISNREFARLVKAV